MASPSLNAFAQICSCTWHDGLREPGIDCPVHRISKPLTKRVEEGMRLRHAAVEQASDKLGVSRDMAYLSHLDRGELLTEVERLRNLAARWAAHRSYRCSECDEFSKEAGYSPDETIGTCQCGSVMTRLWHCANCGYDAVPAHSSEEPTPPHPGPSIAKAFANSPRRVSEKAEQPLSSARSTARDRDRWFDGKPEKASGDPAVLDRRVTVCDKCLCACCWHGEFMCDDARNAGTVDKTIRELLASGAPRESNEYWFKSPNSGKIDQAGLHSLRAYLAARTQVNGNGI